jgi:molecular chaperone DnaK
VKELKEGEDVEAIKKASEELSTAAQVVGMKMYQAESAAEKKAEDDTGESEKEEGVVEGEVTDADEQKEQE